MINKLQSIALMAIMLLLAACSKEATDTPQTEEGGWMPSVTRTGSGSGTTTGFKENILISAVKDLNDISNLPYVFSKVFETEGNVWTEDGTAPAWGDNDSESLHLIATYPASITTIPTTVANGSEPFLMAGYSYQASKPTGNITFTMKHLMGKLQIHIKVEENTETPPTNAKVTLSQCKSIDYSKLLITPSEDSEDKEYFNLGDFKKNDETGSFDCTAFNTIPQTLKKDIQCISFKTGNADYTFTPTADIVLAAGKLTHIYLGVAFDEKVILIGKGVSVEEWGEGSEIPGGEAQI